MNCPKCNAAVSQDSVICQVCGQRLDSTAGDDPATATPVAESLAATRQGGPTAEEDWTAGPWYYSGKAMRGEFLLVGLVTLVFIALGVFVTHMGWMPEGWRGMLLVWAILLAVPVVLGLYQFGVYLYRTMTICYSLTPHRLQHEQGLLIRRKQVIEIFDIDDIDHTQSLWERFVCGNVGTITIRSSDPGTPTLVIRGLANHEEVFQKIDDARRKQRERRGLKMV